MKDILKLTVLLAVICLLNGLALGLVYDVTKVKIEEMQARSLAESLTGVLPEAARFSERKELPARAGGEPLIYYEGYRPDGAVAGYALEARRQGYGGMIRLIAGLEPGGRIRGIRVLEQAETPGLGARLTEVESRGTLWDRLAGLVRGEGGVPAPAPVSAPEPWFQAQYRGLAPSELRLLKAGESGSGIHAITGATITSRAVTDAVREAAEEFLKAKGGGA